MRQIVLLIIVFYTGTAYSQKDCKTYKDDYVPTDLNDAITYLNCTWSKKDKKEFKKQSEDEATVSLHFGTGLSIRNGWGLWKGDNSLVKYFNSIDIFHPDDMSSIILTSFHRQLNDKEIDLEGQVRKYVQHWEKAKEDKRKWKEENKSEFDSFSIGDSVKMNFTLRVDENKDRVYLMSKTFASGEKPNCVVIGIVRGKKILDNDNYTLVIQVTDICNRKEAQFGNKEKLIVGETFDYSVTYNKAERL